MLLVVGVEEHMVVVEDKVGVEEHMVVVGKVGLILCLENQCSCHFWKTN